MTGGAGFIGSAVVRRAIQDGHNVVNLDALTYAACLENLSSVDRRENYSFEHVDLREREALDAVLARHQPDAIMHLAAESHVDRSIDGPDDFLTTNIVGTFNLLEAARSYYSARGKPDGFRFLHVSTDEVYGSLGEDGLFTETSPYHPNSPYAATKASADHLVRAWAETYNLPVLLTNCSNNYGPFQFPEKLIPVIILNALQGKNIPVYGAGTNVRDWLYVDDHADALLHVLAHAPLKSSFNIGGNNEAQNIDIVRKICRLMDVQRPGDKPYENLIRFVDDRPGHDHRYAIDATKIRTELGWEPSVTLETGLAKTVEWYLSNEGWWRPLLERQGVGARLGTAK